MEWKQISKDLGFLPGRALPVSNWQYPLGQIGDVCTLQASWSTHSPISNHPSRLLTFSKDVFPLAAEMVAGVLSTTCCIIKWSMSSEWWAQIKTSPSPQEQKSSYWWTAVGVWKCWWSSCQSLPGTIWWAQISQNHLFFPWNLVL